MEALVVSTAEGVLPILLCKLGNVIATKYKLICGIPREIENLKDELESMTACLRDLNAGSDELHSEQRRTWMKQVREVAYDAEDHIDTFLLQQEAHEDGDTNLTMNLLRKIILPLNKLIAMYNLAKEIRDLNDRAVKISERKQRYNVEAGEGATFDAHAAGSSPNYTDWYHCRLPALNESQLVKSQQAEDIINKVEGDNSSPLKVFSIIGFGGIGKTALALKIYNRPTVKAILSRAFVSVSQNYDRRILLQHIFRQLIENSKATHSGNEGTNGNPLSGNTLNNAPSRPRNEESTDISLEDIDTWDISELITRCNTYLLHQRYFIVLDDVWSSEAWMDLKDAFPDNSYQSRILITGRNRNVTDSCPNNIEVDHMDPLDPRESKNLLFKSVFGEEQCPVEHQILDTSADNILEKCGGLPLAIVTIGGMLARVEKTTREWENVSERMGEKIDFQRNNVIERMRKIVSLSYNDLPYHLKACFLYLSIFPDPYKIKRGPLVRQWVAEGFISGAHQSNMEKVAEMYLDEFVSRSMVIPTRIAATGVVRACKVHDIMLKVITFKSIQENFVSFMGTQEYRATGHDKIRRLSIRANKVRVKKEDKGLVDTRLNSDKEKSTCVKKENKEQEDKNMKFLHARSLSILHGTDKPESVIYFARLKLLRVLDLEGCQWLSYEDLKEICELSLLRYLCLRGTKIREKNGNAVSELPKEVGKLKELLTLDIRETSITTLPEAITQLGRLRHLLGGAYYHHPSISRIKCVDAKVVLKMPPGLKKMKSLEKIAHIDIGSSFCDMVELGELSHVTKLSVTNMETGGAKWEPFAASWSNLCESIRHLSITHFPKGDMAGLEFITKVQSTPFFLEKLCLWGTLIALPPWIINHRNLVDLSLRESFLGEEQLRQLGELPSLLSLRLYSQSYVGEKLCFQKNQFPELKQLIIDYLPNLKMLSFEGGATKLQRLTLAFLEHHDISGIRELRNLKEIEFFGAVIIDSLVDRVREEVNYPNGPRVYQCGQLRLP